jgi:hypothetical protein
MLAHAGIHGTEDGAPILNRIMGGRVTSKKCRYAAPPANRIETFRRHDAPGIYPTVRAP